MEAFAVSPPGFEDLVEDELVALGLAARRGPGGVTFHGAWRDLYRANLHCAVASRILLRVAEFAAESFPTFESGLAAIPWERWLPPRPRLALRVSKKQTRLFHTGKVAEAALAVLARRTGAEEAGEDEAQLTLYLRLQGPSVTVSLDTSGAHLHRRGYRTAPSAAPLRENLAAALLARARWNGAEPFLDPLCGSGTLPIEAARLSLGIPAGSLRSFAFELFPDFDPTVWRAVRGEAEARVRSGLPAPVFAADRDPQALKLTASAAKKAGLSDQLQVAVSEVEDLAPPADRGLVMTNPPWGLRLGGERAAYRALGEALRGPFAAWRWAAVFAGSDVEGATGLQPRRRHPFRSGGVRLWLAEGGPEHSPEART